MAASIAHGNTKQVVDAKPFICTAPSVITRLANQTKDHQPSAVHKDAFATAGDVAYLSLIHI